MLLTKVCYDFCVFQSTQNKEKSMKPIRSVLSIVALCVLLFAALSISACSKATARAAPTVATTTAKTSPAITYRQVENSPLRQSVWQGVQTRAVLRDPIIVTAAIDHRRYQPTLVYETTTTSEQPPPEHPPYQLSTRNRGFSGSANARAREKV